jgi:glutamyl-tRNA synthetase
MRDLHARHDGKLAVGAADRVKMGMSGLKERAKLIPELVDFAEFYALPRPLLMNDKASTLVDSEARIHIAGLYKELAGIGDWSESVVDAAVHAFAERESLKLGKIAQPLRAALTGTTTSPGIFEVMAVLGRDETLARLNDVLNDNAAGSA